MNNELIQTIKQNYNLEFEPKWERVSKGFLTDNYILGADNTRYFLKRYRYDDESRIQAVHDIKLYFANHNIPVIVPVLQTNRKSYFEYEGRFYTLFPFVKGIITERSHLSANNLASAAKMLTKIHLAGQMHSMQSFYLFATKTWTKQKFHEEAKQILGVIESKSELNEFDLAARDRIEKKIRLSQLIPQEGDTDFGLVADHLIHGDYQEQNIFFDESGQVSHVFDWEKSGIGVRVQELIRATDLMCFDGEFNQNNFRKADIFLRTYNQIYPMEKSDFVIGLNADYAKGVHSLWVEKAHYLENNTRTDEFLWSGIKHLNYYSEHKDEIIERLASNFY